MFFGAEVGGYPPIILAHEEHRGDRRDAEGYAGLARKQRHLHLERRIGARPQVEAIGAGRRFAVEQGVDRDGIGLRTGGLNPELPEEGDFLLLRAGIHRQASRRHAVMLAAAKEAEIAATEERDYLVEAARVVQWIVQAEAGEAQIDRQGLLEVRTPVIEHVRRIGNGRGDAIADRVDRHGAPVEMAEVEGLQPEGAI